MTNPDSTDPLRASAFHAAAHAVIARHFGYAIERVWIDESTLNGGCDIGSADVPPQVDFMIAFASQAALEAFDIPEPHGNSASRDQTRMWDIVAGMHPDDDAAAKGLFDELCDQTYALFRQHKIRGQSRRYSRPQVSWDRHSRNVGRRRRHPER